jgi:hypothetical protein
VPPTADIGNYIPGKIGAMNMTAKTSTINDGLTKLGSAAKAAPGKVWETIKAEVRGQLGAILFISVGGLFLASYRNYIIAKTLITADSFKLTQVSGYQCLIALFALWVIVFHVIPALSE